MKRFILALLVAMLLALTACGAPAGQAPDTPPAQEPGNTLTAQPAAPQKTESEPEPESTGGVLVVYYSATGCTEAVAGYIANALEGDIFAITPVELYTSADLNWRDRNSRSSREHDDPSLRVMELTKTTVDGWENYDTVFIGYPIWWGIAAWPEPEVGWRASGSGAAYPRPMWWNGSTD